MAILCRNHKSRSSEVHGSSSFPRAPFFPKSSTQCPDPASCTLPNASPSTKAQHPLPETRSEDPPAKPPGRASLPSSRSSFPLWLHHLQTTQTPRDSCRLPLLLPSQFLDLLAQEFNQGCFLCPSLEIRTAVTQTCTEMPWLLLQQKPFYRMGFE